VDALISKILSGDTLAIAFCVAGFSVLATWYSFYFQYRVWNWPWVWGELLKGEVGRLGSGSDRTYLARVEYKYTVDGQEYTGHRLSAMSGSGNVTGLLETQLAETETNDDGKVKVYYNPKRPQKAFLIRGARRQVILTFLYFLGAFAVTVRCADMLELF